MKNSLSCSPCLRWKICYVFTQILGFDSVISGLPRIDECLPTLTSGLRSLQPNNSIRDLDAKFCSRISAYCDHSVKLIQRCCLCYFEVYSVVSMSTSSTLTIAPLLLQSLSFTAIERQHIQSLIVYFILLTLLIFFQHHNYLPQLASQPNLNSARLQLSSQDNRLCEVCRQEEE